jgi:glycine C-acetyltransferase
MLEKTKSLLADQLAQIRAAGLYKSERILSGPQGSHVTVAGREVLNFCANNYLGLAAHPEVIAAARASLDQWGYGLASVRFICGTQEIHKTLERAISDFLSTDDTILYSSCFDANGGLFETLLGPEDAIISDELNHASIIDGIRLCKAQRFRYKHGDMMNLEEKLREVSCLNPSPAAKAAPSPKGEGLTAPARIKMIATDGVFSMDGDVARLKEICDLADKYESLVMVDDSHAVGVLGRTGHGSPEHCGVTGRIDIITGTLGKALGGASGGYTSARREIVELLRQRSRPYLFSNTVAPTIVAASIKALELLKRSTELRDRLAENTRYFRAGLAARGFSLRPGDHPIIPIMLGEATAAQTMAAKLLEKGVYAIGFFYPVVTQGAARIRVQISAAHSRSDLDAALAAFAAVKKEMGL